MKSPPHLEPWDIQRFLEHGVAVKGRENASAPQNGISSQTQQGIPPQGFQNHIPARGRKLSWKPLASSTVENFKTISPQGDGNLFSLGRILLGGLISKPYPRKGTETILIILIIWYFKDFKTISPQGDGNSFVFSFADTFVVISKPYPRKGTETTPSITKYPLLSRCYFKTISPQGDGNSKRCASTASSKDIISKPYPRKGTETSLLRLDNKISPVLFQNHIPARGRKPKPDGPYKYNERKFQNHIPARGRKQVPGGNKDENNVFQNHIPARGRKQDDFLTVNELVNIFQNHIPARGRKHLLR